MAKEVSSGSVFQFVEGLGLPTIARGAFDHHIAERRTLHPAAYDSGFNPHLLFPKTTHPDVHRDVIEEEFALADQIVVYSELAAQTFVDQGFARDRLIVAPVPGALPLPHHGAAARDETRFAFVGRGTIHKGLDVAVAAVKRLGIPYTLDVAGPVSRDVRDWLGNFEHVRYRGTLARPALQDLYRTCAAILSPSAEGYGFVPLEAATQGGYTICSHLTGVKDHFHPDAIKVVRGRAIADWEAALSEFIANPAKDDLRELARQSSRTFDPYFGMDVLEATYSRLRES